MIEEVLYGILISETAYVHVYVVVVVDVRICMFMC